MTDFFRIPTDISNCFDLMAELEHEIANVDAELTEAKQNARVKGEYADPTWFRETERRRGHLSAHRLRLEGVMHRLRRGTTPDDGFYSAVGKAVIGGWELDSDDIDDLETFLEEVNPEYSEILRDIVGADV